MARGRLFYGWWVTIAFAVMVFLSTGVRFSVGPFLKPMVADLGTDRASYSLIVAVSLFLYGVFMPFVGRLVVGSVFGTIFVVHQAGGALGSWLGGLLFEQTGGYGAAFTIASVQLLAAAVVSLTIDEAVRCVPRLRPVAGVR